MASASKGKGWVKTREWAKHLRKFGKRVFNGAVRQDGKKQIRTETSEQ